MDVPTLFFVEASLLFLFGLTMVVNSIGQSGQRGNYWFAASNFCGALGLGMHSVVPPSSWFFAIGLANLLLFLELSFLNKAVAEFVEHGRNLWLGLIALSIVVSLLTILAVHQHPNPDLVTRLISIITVSTAVSSAVLLFRFPSPGSRVPAFVMGTLFSLYAANNFIRSFTGYKSHRFYHIWLDRTIIAGLCFGYLWMTAARLRNNLEQLAGTDALTGTLNRRAIERETQRAVQRRSQNHPCTSALMLDVDYFKEINDKHGHHAGDLALQAIANCLRTTMRTGDLIARLGGDEFLVIMPGTNAEMATLAADRLHDNLADLRIATETGEFSIRASIGVTSIQGSTLHLEDLMKLGDRALYAAKATTRREVRQATEFVS